MGTGIYCGNAPPGRMFPGGPDLDLVLDLDHDLVIVEVEAQVQVQDHVQDASTASRA
jgi:hypothetical protein